MAKAVACAWLRNDLRVHDSAVLHKAAELSRSRGMPVLPVYVLDPRHYGRTRYGTQKTGPIRALFLLQSVLALKRRLRELGSDLLIKIGRPEEVLPSLLPRGSCILTQEEVTSEELMLDKRVRSELEEGVLWEYCWGPTLFHRDDLPFRSDLKDMPDVYTSFKNQVEPELACKANEVPPTFNDAPKPLSRINVRPCLPTPSAGCLPLPELEDDSLHFEPAWSDIPYEEAVPLPEAHHEGAVLQFHGGEDVALDRLQYYIADTSLISTYFETRNEMLGGDYSTKLAPWLACGCLSVRKVFQQLRTHEMRQSANKSTYWILFGLGARDFFRYYASKHGDAIFREHGPVCRKQSWKGGDEEFELWANGKTGFPFVDANMRELRDTGFMSNRGRQVVASFLIFNLGVDWRRGADWFESTLIDYDVTSNWSCWVFAAGLTGGRINRFNVMRQAKNYDPSGDYVRHWLPELQAVPTHFVHEPWLMSEQQRADFGAQEYPQPCMDPTEFPSGAGPVPVQLKGRGRGRPSGPVPSSKNGGGGWTPARKDKDTARADVALQDQSANGEVPAGKQSSERKRRWQANKQTTDAGEDFNGPSWLAS